MRRALYFAPLFVLGLLGPVPAPPPPPKATGPSDKPAVVIQSASVSTILTKIRDGIKYTGGASGDKFLLEFENEFEKLVGKEGLDGIDTTKPCVGYVSLEKDPDQSYGILLFATPGEDKLVAMFKHTQFKLEPVNPGSGLYKLTPPGDKNTPFRVRVKDGYAYLGINVSDAVMAPEALVSAGKLLDPAEKATLCVTAQPGKIPAGLFELIRNDYGGELDRDIKRAERNEKAFMVDLIKEFRKLCDKGMGHLEKDVETARWRLDYDSKTGALLDETTFVPKAGTVFGKDVESWGKTTNRFAGMAEANTAAWGITKIPVFNVEVKGMLNALLKGGADHVSEVPEIGQPVVKELIALGRRTVEKGEGDLGVALHGPTKDGTFTVALAVVAEDPTAVETELKKLVKSIPIKEITDVIKLDVETVDGVNLHEMAIGALLPPDVQKIFGKDCMLVLGVSKTALYAGFGPEARAKVKAAVVAKPGSVDAFALHFNPVKITALAKTADEKFGDVLARSLSPDNKLMPFWTVTVTGGTELTVKNHSQYLLILKVMFTFLEGLFKN
jgi:hypothetical protein